MGEPGGPQTRSLYFYDNLGALWNRAHLMTTTLGASAREALIQLIAADAANGEGPFAIFRFQGRLPWVVKGQFHADISGGALLELERAGVLWSDRRDADNRLKTFYLSSDSRQLLHPAIAAAGEPTPLLARAPQPPGEGRGGQPRTGPRRPGRPKGTRSVTRDQIIDVFRSLRTNYGRAPTQAELAANLHPRIEPRTLQEHLTAYDLPWPIELE